VPIRTATAAATRRLEAALDARAGGSTPADDTDDTDAGGDTDEDNGGAGVARAAAD
jgi:hypothetical protein